MKNNMRLLLAKQRKKTADVAEATGISKSTLTALYYERAKNPSLDKIFACLLPIAVSRVCRGSYSPILPYFNALPWYCFRWQARATRRKERTNGIGLYGRQERAVYTEQYRCRLR
ncbi:HTH DNA-binding protein [Streptococcus pneumoniae]|nr:HTH DNA-binding protein [Streptococcus pneumoniae]